MFLRVAPILIYLGLVVYTLADLAQYPAPRVAGFPRWAWALMIILLPFIGAIGWLFARRGNDPQPPARGRGSGAPDDDPEYLAWLRDQARRRKES